MNLFTSTLTQRPASLAPNVLPGRLGVEVLSLRQEAPGAVSVPASGPNRLDRPSGFSAPRFCAIPANRLQSVFSPPKTPRFDALLSEAGRQLRVGRDQVVEFRALAEGIQARAADEEWSARRFSKETGIARTTWKRLLAGEADLGKWLHKVRAAAESLRRGRKRAA